MTDTNTFQCQTVTLTHCQNYPALGLPLTLQADGGSTALVAGDALPPEPFPGTGGDRGCGDRWLALTTASIQLKAWALTSAVGTAAHENSPASSLLFPSSSVGSTRGLGTKLKPQETGSVQICDPTQGNRPNTAFQ